MLLDRFDIRNSVYGEWHQTTMTILQHNYTCVLKSHAVSVFSRLRIMRNSFPVRLFCSGKNLDNSQYGASRLMQWLQLRFDGRSTAVRLFIKGH